MRYFLSTSSNYCLKLTVPLTNLACPDIERMCLLNDTNFPFFDKMHLTPFLTEGDSCDQPFLFVCSAWRKPYHHPLLLALDFYLSSNKPIYMLPASQGQVNERRRKANQA